MRVKTVFRLMPFREAPQKVKVAPSVTKAVAEIQNIGKVFTNTDPSG